MTFATSTSLSQIVQQICDVFPLDKAPLAQANLDWQAKLLGKCAGHVFVPRPTSHDADVGEDSLIVSSLTLLTLRAELVELTNDNGNLNKEKQRLQRSVVDLEKENAKTKRVQTSKPSEVKTAHKASVIHSRGPHLTQSSRFTGERQDFFGSDDQMDPSMVFALQLQATFDSENEHLLKQKHELMRTAQRQYHCGVCLDDFPEDDVVHIDACGHEICRDCTRGHVYTKIEEHRFPVLCPVCMADHRNQNPGSESQDRPPLTGIHHSQPYRGRWCSCSASPRNSGRSG